MKTKTMILLALAGAVGLVARASAPIAAAKSPDGRNEIRLYASPLAYEVLRDGVTLAARAEIGLTVDGKPLAQDAAPKGVVPGRTTGTVQTPVYKKDAVDLSGNETFVDFGDWGVRRAARDDGVAYRFATKRDGQVTVDAEQAGLAIPDAAAKCWVCETGRPGCEESVPVSRTARDLRAAENSMYYLPFVYTVGGKCVAVTESDVRDYPVWNLVSSGPVADNVARFGAKFECAAKSERHSAGGKDEPYKASGGRWVRIQEHEKFLVRTSGARTFPWRTFVLADAPAKLCEADIVYALAPAPEAGADFSWVKPGKVAWDWWNCFDNAPRGTPNGGCTTKTYERFIDFARKSGVEYVIFDEGWSKSLDIWNYHPQVDVPHLIEYANARGVGIILWMAWAQVVGEEERVAEHFAKLGAKGFKVDFMDRGDAGVTRFLEKFAAACAKNRMLVDYHGVCRPTGLHRRYPNVVNYEGVHGLENMKWHGCHDIGAMFNDVAAFFLRMTAGPMDFTPGAMLNHAVGAGYKGAGTRTPGAVGTRCRQMAMMALYEAPLQMLCDSPTNYERNMECFSFMARTPVVWSRTVGLGGCPDTYALAARQAKDGTWYAGAINTAQAKSVTLDTAFLGEGEFAAEIFRDAPDSWDRATSYVRETRRVKAGEKLAFDMAPGGGFVVRFAKAEPARGGK